MTLHCIMLMGVVGVVEVLLMLHLRHRRPLLAIPLPINLFLLHQR